MRDFSLIWSEKTVCLKTLRVLIFLACLFKVNLYKKLQMLMAVIVQLNSRKCNVNAITGCVGEDASLPKRNIVFSLFLCLLFPQKWTQVFWKDCKYGCNLALRAGWSRCVYVSLSELVYGIWPIRILSWSQAAKWLSVFFCCNSIPYRVKPFRLYFKVQYAPLRR